MTQPPRKPQMVLHIGAPKCGSSALQAALSLAPDLKAVDGTKYRYTSVRYVAGKWRPLYGAGLSRKAHQTPYGYLSWPDLGNRSDLPELFAQMHKVLRKGRARRHVPILSSEAWINHAQHFAESLAAWGHPPIDVVVFLRPVVDWVNAAFWQWGIWHTPDLDTWLARSNMSYSFAEGIAAWQAIPNVRVIVCSQRPDVVGKFSKIYGLPLESERQSNLASSATLIGVLLRNRALRPDGHAGAIEFIVQRWCPPVAGRKLWSVLSRHVQELRPVRDQVLETLRAQVPPDDLAELLTDPRWTREVPYHSDILAGITRLNDPLLFAPLYHALHQGIEAAATASKQPMPQLPSLPENADIAAWDGVICPLLTTLVELDELVRHQTIPLWQRRIRYYFLRQKGPIKAR